MITGVLTIALVRPQTLKRVKLSGFELEMLARVREKQAEHQDQLDGIRLILPLLLPDDERLSGQPYVADRAAAPAIHALSTGEAGPVCVGIEGRQCIRSGRLPRADQDRSALDYPRT